jgi:hypothetical protein
MTNDTDITLADIFAHMRTQTIKIDALQKQVKVGFETIQDNFKAIDTRFDEIEKRLEHLEQDVFILIARKNDHEERLNIIEKVQLPKMRKSISNLSKKNREKKTPILQRTR